MRWKLTGFVMTCLCIVIATSGASYSQVRAPLFVVYGNVTNEYGIPIDGGYIITVENKTRNKSLEAQLESGADAGKYTVVFFNYSGGSAIEEGNVITIAARLDDTTAGEKSDDPGIVLISHHLVTAEEVLNMRLKMDAVLANIAVLPISWGEIKTLFL